MSETVFREKVRLSEYYEAEEKNLNLLGRTICQNILPMPLKEFKIAAMSYRVKERVKALAKLEKKYSSQIEKGKRFEELLIDLVGIRVVCLYQDDVKRISEKLLGLFDCEALHFSDKYSLNDEEPERFGYRAIHCVGRLGGGRRALDEYSMLPDCLFEIQVRTIIQDSWANLSHAAYHSPPPPIVRRKLAVVAALLEIADREFLEIREETA